MGEGQFLQSVLLGKLRATYKSMKPDPYYTSYTKINELKKWIKDLKVRAEIMKLLEGIGNKLLDVSLGDDFLDLTPKAKATKA